MANKCPDARQAKVIAIPDTAPWRKALDQIGRDRLGPGLECTDHKY